jgi:hypothetical protein
MEDHAHSCSSARPHTILSRAASACVAAAGACRRDWRLAAAGRNGALHAPAKLWSLPTVPTSSRGRSRGRMSTIRLTNLSGSGPKVGHASKLAATTLTQRSRSGAMSEGAELILRSRDRTQRPTTASPRVLVLAAGPLARAPDAAMPWPEGRTAWRCCALLRREAGWAGCGAGSAESVPIPACAVAVAGGHSPNTDRLATRHIPHNSTLASTGKRPSEVVCG